MIPINEIKYKIDELLSYKSNNEVSNYDFIEQELDKGFLIDYSIFFDSDEVIDKKYLLDLISDLL